MDSPSSHILGNARIYLERSIQNTERSNQKGCNHNAKRLQRWMQRKTGMLQRRMLVNASNLERLVWESVGVYQTERMLRNVKVQGEPDLAKPNIFKGNVTKLNGSVTNGVLQCSTTFIFAVLQRGTNLVKPSIIMLINAKFQSGPNTNKY